MPGENEFWSSVEMSLSLRPKRVFQFLILIVLILLFAHIGSQILQYSFGSEKDFDWIPLFDFDREMNFPTYFSSTTLLACSVLLGIIAIEKRKTDNRSNLYWLGLALIFLFLSFDEYSSLHEKLILPLQSLLNTSGILFFAWVIPYGIALIIIGLVYLRFLIRLPPKTRNLIFLGALLYVLGALGMEMAGGYYYDFHDGKIDMVYSAITTVEELLELLGIQVFVYALLSYIETEFVDLKFRITFSSPASSSSQQQS